MNRALLLALLILGGLGLAAALILDGDREGAGLEESSLALPTEGPEGGLSEVWQKLATTPFEEGAGAGARAGTGHAMRVMTRAEFFERLRDLGFVPSEEMFERIHSQRSDRGALALVVTNEEGEVIEGATVFVEPATRENLLHHVGAGEFSAAVTTRTTGSDGLAFFKNLVPGPYLLTIEHASYTTFYLGFVEVPMGRPTYVEAILTRPDAVIAGRVVAGSGAALPDVDVTARRYVEGGPPFTASVKTGIDGRFELMVEEGAQYEVTASRTGFKEVRQAAISAGTHDLEIKLEETATAFISGYVTRGNTNDPITAFRIDGEDFLDPDGAFRIERNVMAEQSQQLVFSAEGYESHTITLTVASEQEIALGRVPLFGGKTLNGIVLLQEPDSLRPAAGASVSLVTEAGETFTMSATADGAFSFRRLAADRVTLSTSAPGALSTTREISLLAGETTYVEVILQSSAPGGGGQGDNEVSGTITDKDTGLPLAGVLVKVVEAQGLSDITDGSGGFRITGIPFSEFSLEAGRPGYRTETSPVLPGRPQGTVWNAALTPAGLRLRFRIDADPAPQGTEVILWKAIPPGLAAALAAQADLANHRFEGMTGADGTVTFDVPDGSYFVQVPDFRLHPTPVQADHGNQDWIDIQLPGRTLLSGQITAADGSPVANTSFWLHSGDQDYSTMFLYHTDATGRYSVPHLAARPYALSIIKNSLVQSAQHVVELTVSGAPNQTFDVSFPPLTAQIHGHVTDENGLPKSGIHVGVEFLDAAHRSILAGWVQTAPDGSYVVPFLEPGHHRVRTTWSEDVSVFSDVITLAPGDDVQVDLVAPRVPGRHVSGHIIASDGGPLGPNFLFATDSQGRQNGNFFSTMDWAYVGSFDIRGLAPDTYTITVTAMGCRKKLLHRAVGSNVSGQVVVMERE